MLNYAKFKENAEHYGGSFKENIPLLKYALKRTDEALSRGGEYRWMDCSTCLAGYAYGGDGWTSAEGPGYADYNWLSLVGCMGPRDYEDLRYEIICAFSLTEEDIANATAPDFSPVRERAYEGNTDNGGTT